MRISYAFFFCKKKGEQEKKNEKKKYGTTRRTTNEPAEEKARDMNVGGAEVKRKRSGESGRTSVVARRWSSPKYARGTPRTMTSGRLSSASPLTSAALAHS